MTIQPHVNERTARMRRQVATGGVRGTVCGTAGRRGGGVSSAIAPLFSYGMRRSAAACSSRKSHRKLKTPPENRRGFYSGDVLLSHGLSPYYHRGCSVSLPCSEWERVVPLRYCHQSAEPHWRFAAVAATQARSRVSGDFGRFRSIALPKFRKNMIFIRHS
jgi:hypothetical protein